MKKYLVLALLFASSFAYSQKNDTCDYFSVGAYGGSYISRGPVVPVNDILNSVVVEMEYRKTKDFSFFANVLYMFPDNDIKKMYSYFDYPYITPIVSPETQKGIVTLGGKYYLSSNKINTFVQLGLSQEFSHIGMYSYIEDNGYGPITRISPNGYWHYKYSMMAGAGINFKLSRKLLFEFQYNCYRNIEADDGNFLGFTFYGGLKYNIF